MPETKLSLEWLILTATRQTEVRLADWSEIDLKAKTWTIPEARMKMGAEHVIPLTPRMMQILADAKALQGDAGLIFKGAKGKPQSENTHANLAKSVSGDDAITAHGFRSTFRDWASERTSFPNEVIEKSLAHATKSATEAAYFRSNLIERRRELMAAWCNYVSPMAHGSNVVTLARA